MIAAPSFNNAIMSHDHAQQPQNYNAAFGIAIVLNTVYIAAEVVFGFWLNSLALLADAGHNASDVLALMLAWGAHYLSRFPPTERRTYGLRSTSILAALANALILLVAVGGITWEALRRFADPAETAPISVMWVAGVGIVINAVTALLFWKGRHEDLNIHGAFLHMAADAAVSLGVVLAAGAIYLTGWQWLDPAASLVIAVVILIGTWQLFRESTDLALHAVPKGIDTQQVESYLTELPGVVRVHDLHIWGMSTTETALTAHLVKPDLENDDGLLARATEALHERFGIGHVTLQIERCAEDAMCRQVSREDL